ncbi:putative secreted protein (Por secretion system target) [Kordia periserrulae]|uniref:Putative secreted protein (Por secretion system target) n=1 Tax=Kordia periserrulae TaxID=701523 RepID=A0A2T6BVI4_9FLAO|nr:lamin tail domain-containing protein [Kordia periserrulae]PTX60036.1 putative secreted protein (Por secretion system target) [Kordia periserrulae]
MKKKITPVFFFLMCLFSQAQILTFDFNGLAGNETSAVSNSNDANLTTSTITRGSGLTASNNANRFNAQSWATTSIANAVSGNDYMEFTITPNSGFEFNVTTMVFNVQRSGTGLRGIALRSSIDAYAANIDTEMAIADNTSVQTITFTVNQTGNTAAVTYRIYGWAEATGGSGGFEGTGNDIIVNGTVSASCTDAMDFANVQFPTTSQTITVGDSFTVFAQGYEPGVTEAAGAGTGVEAWIGYNTTNNDPSVGAGWTWISATFNVQSGNNDEFSAEIGSALPTGTYYYASRFRLNSCNFTYGGSGGVWNNDSVQLTVNPDVADFCNVDFPKTATITQGDTFNVYAQVYEPGITDAVGQGANVEAWIGYNTTDNDPRTDAGWTWVAATYDSDSGNNDQYTAEIGSALTAGTYYYASRFRINSSDFTYGGILADNMGNFWDPVTYNSGILTINPPPTANVVITEIMYNTSGTDDEWIEICNVSGSLQDISSYIIDVGGITEHTFGGSTTLADGACITISLGSNGDGTYNPGCNFTPDEGEDASTNNTNNLVNSSATITLFAADGTTVADVVTYSNTDGANGNDASLHVIDATLDNSDTGTNWQEVLNGGSPGTNALISPCSQTQVQFVATSSTLAEDGAFIDICVAITNPSGSVATTVEVALDGASTATNGTDYDDGAGTPAAISFPVTLTFPAGSSTNECITIFISNDDAVVEPSETVILNLQNASGGTSASIGTNTTHTLTITDNDGAGSGDIMITQYYEGAGINKWIEVKNVSGAIIPANTYYIVILNNADADNPAAADPTLGGSPSVNNNILISTDMAVDEVRRYKHDSATIPAYATPGEVGYDGNPTFSFAAAASMFSGDDLVIISTTNDSTTWANRVDVIGDGTLWGDRRCFVRNSCVATGPSTTFDVTDWVEFTDTEVASPASGTNPYLGEHEEGITSWNGSAWSNGTPDRSRVVTLSGNYDTSVNGDLTVCSLTIDTGVTTTIPSGTFIDIQNDLTVNSGGTLTVANQGSLVMVDDTGVVTANGTITVEKTTTSFEQYDYTYWSSPVVSETIGGALGTWRMDRAYAYVASNYEDLDNDEIDDNNDVWSNVTSASTMTPGVGYAVMGPTTGSFPRTEAVTFSGAVNNGVITSSISLSADNTDADDDWNLVGNPYPSAISADDFVALNTNITGTLYFWTHVDDASMSNPGPDLYNFSTDDYAMYNAVGSVGTSSVSGSTAPTGFIASGQGFFLEAITAGSVTFNNSLRSSAYDNSNFYRQATDDDAFITEESIEAEETQERNRIWLNLTNADGAFSQILIGFLDDATLQKDRLYDGIRLNGFNYLRFYSKDDTHTYGIQGRPTFTDTDIVPLGYDSAVLGNITISIDQIEGILNTADVDVFLKDLDLNITHNLKVAPYTFTTTDGTFPNRFQLQFINNILSVDEEVLPDNALAVYLNNNKEIEIQQRTRTEIKSVKVYSVVGQLIGSTSNMNKKISLHDMASGVYIVVIDTEKGSVVKKITR